MWDGAITSCHDSRDRSTLARSSMTRSIDKIFGIDTFARQVSMLVEVPLLLLLLIPKTNSLKNEQSHAGHCVQCSTSGFKFTAVGAPL